MRMGLHAGNLHEGIVVIRRWDEVLRCPSKSSLIGWRADREINRALRKVAQIMEERSQREIKSKITSKTEATPRSAPHPAVGRRLSIRCGEWKSRWRESEQSVRTDIDLCAKFAVISFPLIRADLSPSSRFLAVQGCGADGFSVRRTSRSSRCSAGDALPQNAPHRV